MELTINLNIKVKENLFHPPVILDEHVRKIKYNFCVAKICNLFHSITIKFRLCLGVTEFASLNKILLIDIIMKFIMLNRALNFTFVIVRSFKLFR
jgi:hypothetical protein